VGLKKCAWLQLAGWLSCCCAAHWAGAMQWAAARWAADLQWALVLLRCSWPAVASLAAR